MGAAEGDAQNPWAGVRQGSRPRSQSAGPGRYGLVVPGRRRWLPNPFGTGGARQLERRRKETPLQRADRAYGEILQEVRVAQTGVQILFAFLLTLAFTPRFKAITR
jgi:hypothetical protein